MWQLSNNVVKYYGFNLTYLSWNVLAIETKADCNVETIHLLRAIIALGSCDVDGGWQENIDVHCNDGSGSGDQWRSII